MKKKKTNQTHNRQPKGMHAGLEQLCGVLKTTLRNRGFRTIDSLADLSGASREALRKLLYGQNHFAARSPENDFIADALTLATGVDNDLRGHFTDSPIKDIWGEPYTVESFTRWQQHDLTERIICHVTGRKPVSASNVPRVRPGHPLPVSGLGPTINPLKEQHGLLIDMIYKAVRPQGRVKEIAAANLIKAALVDVAHKLGVLEREPGAIKLKPGSMRQVQDKGTVQGLNYERQQNNLLNHPDKKLPLQDIVIRFPRRDEGMDALNVKPVFELVPWRPKATALRVVVEPDWLALELAAMERPSNQSVKAIKSERRANRRAFKKLRARPAPTTTEADLGLSKAEEDSPKS